jgi:NitT/TauT family transport system ATP-binding protein
VPAASAVRLRGVSHTYPGADGALRALDGIDLDIAPGEFVSIVGPSGCGKTTLLRAVAGLLTPTEGDLAVLDGSAEDAQRAHAFGLVAQEPGLLPWRTVEANVRLPLEITGRDADIPALLQRVGIAGFERYRPGQLSGGMRQRVALARALVHSPRLLLMDEPFGALDELSREAMRLELLRLWEEERITVLFVTHAVREAVLLSDRVIVMSPRPGRIVTDLRIDLPRPRSDAMEDTPAFLEIVARLRAALNAPVTTPGVEAHA